MDNKIFLVNEEVKEVEMNILFTFDMNEKNYCILYENGKDDDLMAFEYDDEGNLSPVEDEELMEEIQEIVDAFDGINDEEDE